LLNELIACSTNNSDSFSFDRCPDACIRSNNPFWNAASRHFASKTEGQALIVLNGTRTVGALFNGSTFFRYELPALETPRVRELRALVVHNPDQEKYETCAKPKSLGLLKASLDSRNISYVCEDNPEIIKFYMCFANPLSKECVTLKYLTGSANSLIQPRILLMVCMLFLVNFFMTT
jgi:hypothetical protein